MRRVYRTVTRCDTQTPLIPWRNTMKRFAPLALIVLALAVVPAAFADDGAPAPTTPTTTAATQTQPDRTAPAQQNAGRPGVQLRVEILRLRLQIVELRF